jgi:GDPmannose 4,6-dehydratase
LDERIARKYIDQKFLAELKEKVRKKDVIVAVDSNYFRPTEVDQLIGDANKAKEKLGWQPEYTLEALIEDMMQADMKLMQKEAYLREAGFKTLNYFE